MPPSREWNHFRRHPMEKIVATPHGGDRSKVETFHLEERQPGKTRDKIGDFAGVSGRTVDKIRDCLTSAPMEQISGIT